MNEILISRALGIYELFLLVGGSTLNVFTFITCIRKRLRNIPTFVFIAVMALVDIIPLYVLNLSFIYTNIFERNIENPVYCILFPFLHTFALQSSSWLLVKSFLQFF